MSTSNSINNPPKINHSASEASDNFGEDPVIVFDKENEDDDENNSPISIGYRQPSFLKLKGEPVPKGYGSIADFRAEKPMVRVLPYVDESGNTDYKSIKDLLQKRNTIKWQKLGYDPQIMQSLNRNTSVAVFTSKMGTKPNGKYSSSFSNIDAFSMLKGPASLNMDGMNIIEESETDEGVIKEEEEHKPHRKIIRRIASNDGSKDLTLVMPGDQNQGSDTFCTEVEPGSQATHSQLMQSNNGAFNGKIPPALEPYVSHEPDTYTYHALCGEKLVGIPIEESQIVISDLNTYIIICAENDLVGEALYIQEIIEHLKTDKTIVKLNADREVNDLNERIQEVQAELKEQEDFWAEREQDINKERDDALMLLDQRYDNAVAQLDAEWQSPDKAAHYTKPSAALLNMRQQLKCMIKAKKFDEVAKISAEIEAKEKQESLEAGIKMQSDYRIADQRLRTLYNTEKIAINGNQETKISQLIRIRTMNMHPIQTRLENLNRLKTEALVNQKKFSSYDKSKNNRTSRSLSTKTTPRCTQSKIPPFIATPKLTVPPLTPIKRDYGSRSQSATICRPKTQQRSTRSSRLNNL